LLAARLLRAREVDLDREIGDAGITGTGTPSTNSYPIAPSGGSSSSTSSAVSGFGFVAITSFPERDITI
jgi:hypothetical protein